MRKTFGFTLIELLTVIALLGIVSTPIFFSFNRSHANQQLSASAEIFADIVKQAHIFARETKDSKTWGVKLQGPKTFILVSQSETIPEQQEKTYTLDRDVEFISPDFTLWFSKGLGHIDAPQIIYLKNKFGVKLSVVVSTTGTAEVKP